MSDSAADRSGFRRVPAWLAVLAPAVLLAAHLALLAASVSRKCATVDEFVHVPSGVYYWQTGDFSLSGLNPPLAKLFAALPVLAMNPKMPIALPPGERAAEYPWAFGRLFMLKNWDAYDAMLFRSRATTMLLSVLAGLALFLWARRLTGFWPALLALALYAFEPNVIAHGRLATQDTAMMLLFVVTLAALNGVIERGGWWRVFALGVTLGAACLVKFSGLLLVLAVPLALAACVLFVGGFRLPLAVPGEGRFRGGRPRASWQALVAVVAAVVVALLVINAVYGFSGSFQRVDPSACRSSAMKSLASGPLGVLPVPLPRVFVAGLDGQQASVEQGESTNYLNGQWSATGWWYYYLEAFALKTPLPVMVLVLAGVVSVFVVPVERKAAMWVAAATAGLFWAMHSFGANKQIGLRYMLPLFPLAFMLAGRAALMIPKLSGRARAIGAVALVLLAGWTAADAAVIFPDYLAYFNPLAGGPDGGPRYLLDSNIDWGQDLPALADYLKREGITGRVYMGYFGEVAPELYGIKPRNAVPGAIGTVIVSANFLYGMPYGGFKPGDFEWLRLRKPDAIIGHTLYVYRTDQR